VFEGTGSVEVVLFFMWHIKTEAKVPLQQRLFTQELLLAFEKNFAFEEFHRV
jgi:hypothetical protein